MAFLIFLPLLTTLVYLIARGGSMAERSDRSTREAETAGRSCIREVAGKTPSEEITAASALLTTISQDELDRLKTDDSRQAERVAAEAAFVSRAEKLELIARLEKEMREFDSTA